MFQDLRYALRQFRQSPGFAAVAVLTLALGIGVNTALFSIVHGVLLRPLPCPEQERLVTLSEWSEKIPGMSISYPNFLDWRARQSCFTALGVSRRQAFNYTTQSGTERLSAIVASHDYFGALGVPALRGRLFAADDDKAGAERTVVVSEGFWRKNLGARDDALGEKLQLNGDFYTIVGVFPEALKTVGNSGDLAVPLGLWADQLQQRANHPGLYGVARLKPGVTFAAAESEMHGIASQLAAEHPAENTGLSVTVRRLTDAAFGSVRTALWVLLGAAGFVLLIACANVANLQLARAHARSREFAIRGALGAGLARLLRQLATESLLLGLAGSAAGLVLGSWALTGLRTVLPVDIPRLAEVSLDGWVLAFACGAGLLTSVAFGLIPAWFAARQGLRASFAATPGAGGAAHGQRWRAALIVGEFALTCLLVAGAGLMLRTLSNLYRADLGYRTENIVTFDVELAGPAYRQSIQRRAFIEQTLERLAALPGAAQVSVVNPLPLRGGNQSTYYVEGTSVPGPGRAPSAERAQIDGAYFSTLGIALVGGRTFGPQDNDTAPHVAVVDTLFAEKHFPGQNPLGKRFAYGEKPPANDSDWLQIVGIVGHIQNFGLRSPTREQTYLPFTQNTPAGVTFALRTAQDPAALIPAVRATMRDNAAELAVFNFRTMEDRFASSIATERLTVLLLGVFAALALVLAAVGLYGVLSYAVGQRTREIGVRMALGADATSVVALVLRQGARLAGLGLAAGLVAALGATRLLQSLLYGVSAFDPLSLAAVAAMLALVGALACWLPARRATRVDPLVALRSE